MSKSITRGTEAQVVTWETLGPWLQERMQEVVQEVLEAEVTELLGRCKSERRALVDGPAGYRNGHGKPRQLTLGGGTITLRRPRVRGLEERFASRVLPLFARRSQEVSDLLPELYLHGLAEGDFDLALRGLLDEDAPLSASTVARPKQRWQADWWPFGRRSRRAPLRTRRLWQGSAMGAKWRWRYRRDHGSLRTPGVLSP